MKSLMKIYVKYMATAVVLVLAFVVMQLVLLGMISLRTYGDGGFKKYSVRQVYETLEVSQNESHGGQDTSAIQSLEDAGAVFAMLLDDGGSPVWSYQLPENLNHHYTASQIALLPDGIWTVILSLYGAGKRGFLYSVIQRGVSGIIISVRT